MKRNRTPDQPYPGLRPFRKNEWSIFFGREAMIDAVLSRLSTKQMVVIHGSSGCGKSSLITAGVLPRLEQEHSLYGVTWKTTQMRPGSSPLWNLAEAIGRIVEDADDDARPALETTRTIRRLLNLGQPAFTKIDERYEMTRDGSVCVLIDQFEELFRYARETSREEAQTFVEVILGFEEAAPKGIYTIVTMRSDHLGECAQFSGFAELVNETQYLLPRMDRIALMQAIREPARMFGGEVDVELTMRLIDESETELDSLPLVQHCLLRLWLQASTTGQTPRLAVDNYSGLQALLSAHADEILSALAELDPLAQTTAEFLFRTITEIDNEGRGLRRPRTRAELVAVTGNEPELFDRVVDCFADPQSSFLMRSTDQDPIVDISHEALIRCWTRLNDPRIGADKKRPRGWLLREQEDGRLWRVLQIQASSGETIATSLVGERNAWFRTLPGAAWAERYGGAWAEVRELIEHSLEIAEEELRDREANLFEAAEKRSMNASDERLAARLRLVLRNTLMAVALVMVACLGFIQDLNKSSDPLIADLDSLSLDVAPVRQQSLEAQ